ncbi:hypothetical protein ACFC1L_34785 [Streptomyces sp. NPDC056210]|uniref:hypothetical protein n=1 Tax=Streptomyces sp. NPDC056210 TaxID=3345746 RepID=UPI0035DAEAAB
MSSRLWGRRRALAACTGTGTVIALLIAAIVFVIAAPGVPSAWWPQTGDAFASSPSPSDAAATPVQGAAHGQAPAATPSNESEVCDAIVGPAHSYCLGAPAPPASGGKFTLTDSWPLGALGVGVAALFIVSRRRRGL